MGTFTTREGVEIDHKHVLPNNVPMRKRCMLCGKVMLCERCVRMASEATQEDHSICNDCWPEDENE